MRPAPLVPLSLREAAKGNKPDDGDDDANQDAPGQSDDDPCNDKDPAKSDTDAACVPTFSFMRSHQVSFSKVSTIVPISTAALTVQAR
jgi:hypothetical protein